jgi:hypothetical protein
MNKEQREEAREKKGDVLRIVASDLTEEEKLDAIERMLIEARNKRFGIENGEQQEAGE